MKLDLLRSLAVTACLGVFLACGGGGGETTTPTPPPASDFASEASGLGMSLPTNTIQGTSNVTLFASGSTVTSTAGSLSGSTSAGVLTLTATMTTAAAGLSNVRMESWVNGQMQTVSSVTGTGNIVLNAGNNYVAVVIYTGSSPYGRSQVMRVNSTTPGSSARVELSWDTTGDVDLHVDDGSGGKHVYFGSKTYNSGGYNIGLDVDNVTAYGPENIRFYSLPTTSSFRIYVNYYSGSAYPVATVRIFDSGGVKRYEYTHSFTPSNATASSSYGSWSWNVGNLQVTPAGMRPEDATFTFMPPTVVAE